MFNESYFRAHGSLLANTEEGEAAALKVFMSKPVGFGGDMAGRGGRQSQ